MSQNKRYLFICGCPRSGTTALWRLLISHSDIVLGIERYVWLSFKDNALAPELFDRTRFFDLQAGDTFYSDLVAFNPYYTEAADRYDQARWVGDKAPPMYRQYQTIERNFENAQVIFIMRNIIDVAASYQKRSMNSKDKTWNHDRDYRQAVTDWQDSLRRTMDFLAVPQRKTRLTIISYEDLFLHDADLVRIFKELDLDLTDTAMKEYRNLRVRSRQLDAQRGDGLTSEQRHYISMRAPFGLYRDLLPSCLNLCLPTESGLGRVPQLT